jgi:imidazolonepropionase-like amidohydrolase
MEKIMRTFFQDLRYGSRMLLKRLGFTLMALLMMQSMPFGWQAPARALVIKDVAVIDVIGGAVKPHMTVVISGDRITALGEEGKIATPKDSLVVDGRGKFLIPGLWDMHVHLTMFGETALPLLIAQGVTSVRDMGGDFDQMKLLRERIAAGTLLGPRVKAAGPILESARFIEIMKRGSGEAAAAQRIGVSSATEAAQAVASIARLGADFIKIRTNASRESYLAIAAEAKRVGLPLVGHAPRGVSLIEVSDAGQRSIEHGLGFGLNDSNYSEAQWKEIAERFIKNGTRLVPTFVAARGIVETTDQELMAVIDDTTGARDERRKYIPPAVTDRWRRGMEARKLETPTDPANGAKTLQGFRLLYRAGVKFMTGTDLPARLVYPGWSAHEELELLVQRVGLTPLEALQSATRIPAEFFGMADSLGSVEKGKIADLILLEANPLEQISNTKKIFAVIVGGRYYDKAARQKMIESARPSAMNK